MWNCPKCAESIEDDDVITCWKCGHERQLSLNHEAEIRMEDKQDISNVIKKYVSISGQNEGPEIEVFKYAGFWSRFCAMFLDMIIVSPYSIFMLWCSSQSNMFYLYSIVPGALLWLWYSGYLVARYGGTPGKIIMGLNIVKCDGCKVGLREAYLRMSVDFILTMIGTLIMAMVALDIDNNYYTDLNWKTRTAELMKRAPSWYSAFIYIQGVWVWGELLVLLTNKRRRSVHDFIAGTIVIHKKKVMIRENTTA